MAQPIDYFSDQSVLRDLGRKTVRGGMVTGIGQLCIVVLQFLSLPVLGRLLTPADFGLLDMVAVITNFAIMFVDAGLSMATIQRERITHEQVTNVFWFATGMGVAVAVGVAAMSPVIAWFFNDVRLIPVTLCLSVTFVFSGLSIQHRALLRRSMQFWQLALSQLAGVAAGLAAAVVIAWWWRSYWALVVMNIVSMATQTLMSWWLCQWRPGMFRRGTGAFEYFTFGANLTGYNVLNFLSRNVDTLLIGRVWGEVAVGLYGRAYKILLYPLSNIHGPLSSVIIPTLSRLHAIDHERYRQSYLRVTRLLSVLLAPGMAFVAVVPESVVQILLGPQWEAAAPILRWLAISGVFQITQRANGWLLVSQGRVREMLQLGLYSSANNIASFVIGLPWGPVGVAFTYAITGILTRTPVVMWWSGRKGPVTFRDQLEILIRSVGLSVLVAVSAWLAASAIDKPGTWTELIGAAVAGGIVYCIGLISPLSGNFAQDMRTLLNAFRRSKQTDIRAAHTSATESDSADTPS